MLGPVLPAGVSSKHWAQPCPASRAVRAPAASWGAPAFGRYQVASSTLTSPSLRQGIYAYGLRVIRAGEDWNKAPYCPTISQVAANLSLSHSALTRFGKEPPAAPALLPPALVAIARAVNLARCAAGCCPALRQELGPAVAGSGRQQWEACTATTRSLTVGVKLRQCV